MTKDERFRGCIFGGAIGDAWGSGFENEFEEENDMFYLLGDRSVKEPLWGITDDTQLTLATIEGIITNNGINPEGIANQFLKYYKNRTLRGLGSSTLQALKDLNHGGHWAYVGRKGEYAAGNGAAMRIAPLAFFEGVTNDQIRDVCSITHNNDEAYIGARCVITAIRAIIDGSWKGESNLIDLVISQIPDTRVRDRLIEIRTINDLFEVGNLGKDGYVVNSVPLAIAAVNKISKIGIEGIYTQLIEIGGDTDTNCSIAGQLAGTLIGFNAIPKGLIEKLKKLGEYGWIKRVTNELIKKENWV